MAEAIELNFPNENDKSSKETQGEPGTPSSISGTSFFDGNIPEGAYIIIASVMILSSVILIVRKKTNAIKSNNNNNNNNEDE